MKILGLSGVFGHDASACLVVGDAVVAFAEEERFSRIRHAPDAVPSAATEYCLRQGGLKWEDLDAVALGWDPALAPEMPWLEDYQRNLLDTLGGTGRRRPEIVPVPHHLCHAATAYVGSGWDEAAVLVIDGQGEVASTTIAHGRGASLAVTQTFPPGYSLGHLYRSVTRALGFPAFAEGKVMGLSAYGERGGIAFPVHLGADGYRLCFGDDCAKADLRELELRIFRWLEERDALPHNPESACAPARLDDIHLDGRSTRIAASLQETIERAVAHLARMALSQTGSRRLAMAGGLALNCVANGNLIACGAVDEVYVPPVANDAGTSLGAAQVVALANGFKARPASPFLGPRFSHADAASALDNRGLAYRRSNDPSADAARLLIDGNILGWFQGAAEIGPRALGRRSTLALAAGGARQRDRVNRAKRRELWRPFAPSILMSSADRLFHPGAVSPAMTLSGRATALGQRLLDATIHVDGTSRAHGVDAVDSDLQRLIGVVEEETGVPGLLNTSFNCAGQPIVCTPHDAIEAFLNSGLDVLVLEGCIVEKEHGLKRSGRS